MPSGIAQEMAMRLFYLGFILCLGITAPNGATVGKKKPVVLSCIVILGEESMSTFQAFAKHLCAGLPLTRVGADTAK